MTSHLRTIAAFLIVLAPAVAWGQGRQANPNPQNAAEQAREAERAANLAREAERLYARTSSESNDVLTGPVVTDSPFSAEATTTITQILGDGTRIEQRTSARFYRDRIGRVRREQTILGLGALNAAAGNSQTITVDPDPGDGTAYTLDPSARTARRVPRMAGGGLVAIRNNFGVTIAAPGQPGARGAGPQPAANRPTEESLGSRQIEGVRANGRKTTTIIPIGQIGNDRPIEITDERWESPELRMLVYSRNSDPRTGVVEYRLTNINRAEPPADLFMVPADYTILEGGGGGGRGGARSGGPGAQGR